MANKKKFLRQTAGQREDKSILEGQPGRDPSALIVPVSIIKTEKNIRRELSNINELAESIKAHGILQALVVTKGWHLVSGHRRLEAAHIAGLKEIPIRLLDLDEDTAAIAKVIENIQRQQLEACDEVKAVAKLLPIFNNNKTALAESLGKSRTYVSRCCKAAQVVQKIGERAALHAISKTTLFELAESNDPKKLLNQIEKGEVKTTREARGAKERSKSGPVAGGRYGAEGFLQYIEKRGGGAFSFRLNIDEERTPPAAIDKAIKRVEQILERLNKMRQAER